MQLARQTSRKEWLLFSGMAQRRRERYEDKSPELARATPGGLRMRPALYGEARDTGAVVLSFVRPSRTAWLASHEGLRDESQDKDTPC